MALRPALPAVALLCLALAGCSGAGAGEEGPEPVRFTIPARHMLDLQYALSSGATVEWEWSTEDGAVLAFQALYVTDSGTTYPLASSYGASGAGERAAPQSGRYDLTWDNQGPTAITVHIAVTDGYTPATWPPGQGPGCAPLLRLALC